MRKLIIALLIVAGCWFAAYAAHAAEITALPERITAGQPLTLRTSGDGSATLYLLGPGHVSRQEVELGQEVQLSAEHLRSAGRYVVVLQDGSDSTSKTFWVAPGKPADLSFLARPSRVPVARPGVITGAAFVFDDFRNLVVEPATVTFDLAVGERRPASRPVRTRYGVAWVRMDSSPREGAAQFVARVGEQVAVRRVVRLVASDPCNLRIRARRAENAVIVETDPVRDCSGNPVPDGTIVTFMQQSPAGRSTVDAPIRRGVARAELPLDARGTVMVASGVVMGNEIRLGGGR